MVLLMSVNPGFGGQVFIENTYKKVRQLKSLIEKNNPDCLIEVDGGVNYETGKNFLKMVQMFWLQVVLFLVQKIHKKQFKSFKHLNLPDFQFCYTNASFSLITGLAAFRNIHSAEQSEQSC